MDEKKEIVIVSDENGIVAFDDITIKHNTINRAEVAEIEKTIENLEQNKIEIDNHIVEFKAKLHYAKEIIAIADEKRNSEISNAYVANEPEDVGSSLSDMPGSTGV